MRLILGKCLSIKNSTYSSKKTPHIRQQRLRLQAGRQLPEVLAGYSGAKYKIHVQQWGGSGNLVAIGSLLYLVLAVHHFSGVTVYWQMPLVPSTTATTKVRYKYHYHLHKGSLIISATQTNESFEKRSLLL